MNFDDLDQFNENFVPRPPILPGIEALLNGPYRFTVEAVNCEEHAGQKMLKCELKVHTGIVIEKVWWLTSQNNVNRFGADMAALGFDSKLWGTRTQPLSQAIPKTADALLGIVFAAQKTQRTDKEGKTYHDLIVGGRVGANGANGANGAHGAAPTPPPPPAGNDAADLPF